MKLKVLSATAALASLVPSGAHAATLLVSLTGTILKQTAPGHEVAPIEVGDELHLSATIDTSLIRPYGSTGLTFASFYYTGTFSVTHSYYEWSPSDEINDGDDGARGFSLPALIFDDKRVVGVIGHLVRTSGTAPNLRSQGLNPTFFLNDEPFLYNNSYDGPAFEGRWNFDTSSAAVPEPATWAMMIAGFAMLGAAFRSRGRRSATAIP